MESTPDSRSDNNMDTDAAEGIGKFARDGTAIAPTSGDLNESTFDSNRQFEQYFGTPCSISSAGHPSPSFFLREGKLSFAGYGTPVNVARSVSEVHHQHAAAMQGIIKNMSHGFSMDGVGGADFASQVEYEEDMKTARSASNVSVASTAISPEDAAITARWGNLTTALTASDESVFNTIGLLVRGARTARSVSNVSVASTAISPDEAATTACSVSNVSVANTAVSPDEAATTARSVSNVSVANTAISPDEAATTARSVSDVSVANTAVSLDEAATTACTGSRYSDQEPEDFTTTGTSDLYTTSTVGEAAANTARSVSDVSMTSTCVEGTRTARSVSDVSLGGPALTARSASAVDLDQLGDTTDDLKTGHEHDATTCLSLASMNADMLSAVEARSQMIAHTARSVSNVSVANTAISPGESAMHFYWVSDELPRQFGLFDERCASTCDCESGLSSFSGVTTARSLNDVSVLESAKTARSVSDMSPFSGVSTARSLSNVDVLGSANTARSVSDVNILGAAKTARSVSNISASTALEEGDNGLITEPLSSPATAWQEGSTRTAMWRPSDVAFDKCQRRMALSDSESDTSRCLSSFTQSDNDSTVPSIPCDTSVTQNDSADWSVKTCIGMGGFGGSSTALPFDDYCGAELDKLTATALIGGFIGEMAGGEGKHEAVPAKGVPSEYMFPLMGFQPESKGADFFIESSFARNYDDVCEKSDYILSRREQAYVVKE